MSMYAVIGAFELGCIFAILSFGVFISFKILNLPDLTVDGTFTLGAAVSAMLAVDGHPVLGIIAAMLCGACAGGVTALLHTKLKIQSILAGILTMTALYSINLHVMNNQPTVSLFNIPSIFTYVENNTMGKSALLVGLVFVTGLLLYLFLKTQLGLSIRATGDNEVMVRASSINTDAMKVTGLALSNAIVALSGAVLAQYQSFADNQSGIGTMVIALASIIIGDALLNASTLGKQLLSVAVGAVIYRYIYAIALQIGIDASDLKLLSALLVVVAISLPVLSMAIRKRKMREKRNA